MKTKLLGGFVVATCLIALLAGCTAVPAEEQAAESESTALELANVQEATAADERAIGDRKELFRSGAGVTSAVPVCGPWLVYRPGVCTTCAALATAAANYCISQQAGYTYVEGQCGSQTCPAPNYDVALFHCCNDITLQ